MFVAKLFFALTLNIFNKKIPTNPIIPRWNGLVFHRDTLNTKKYDAATMRVSATKNVQS